MILGIFGYGKMGKAIEQLAKDLNQINDVVIYRKNDDLNSFLEKIDIIIDFSVKDATEQLLDFLISSDFAKPLLIGTTALSENTASNIVRYSKKAPVIIASNFSLGANIQAVILEKISKVLAKDYDIDIIDIHHREKLDSPSGTAYMLADHINKGLENAGISKREIVTDRSANPKRSADEIAIASIRAGNATGEHSVIFSGKYDSITISHKVDRRELLAMGAIKTAIWLKDQKAGMHNIREMLNIG